jgi:S-(hydroxymethyl)glutathione dehydrogenase/alcohol dehydrogenase
MTPMRAAVYVEDGKPLELEDLEVLEPGPRDVVVRMRASGICHSDVSISEGRIGIPPPLILGHEGAGVVEAVGSAVTSLTVGDRVVGTAIPACMECWPCLRGQSYLCESQRIRPMSRAARAGGNTLPALGGLGTFAELMTTTESLLVKVETDLPDEQLALIGCGFTTGFGAALNTAAVQPGSTVAVVGCGGVGQAVIQGAGIAGAALIVAVDPMPLKRTTALRLGASHTTPSALTAAPGGPEVGERSSAALYSAVGAA